MSSKFDPTKFARTSLSETMRDPLDPITSTTVVSAPTEPAVPAGAPGTIISPVEPMPAARAARPAPTTPAPRAGSKLVAARANTTKKVQLNMRLDPIVYERAIDAAARVAGDYSLGEIFAEIIDQFEAAANRLATQ